MATGQEPFNESAGRPATQYTPFMQGLPEQEQAQAPFAMPPGVGLVGQEVFPGGEQGSTHAVSPEIMAKMWAPLVPQELPLEQQLPPPVEQPPM
jgi:hypothetical protein